MGNLKPCPFCGGEAEYGMFGLVFCPDCGATIDVNNWNIRAERTCQQVDVTEEYQPYATYRTACSLCGGMLALEEYPAPNYCPNCGARVVEE